MKMKRFSLLLAIWATLLAVVPLAGQDTQLERFGRSTATFGQVDATSPELAAASSEPAAASAAAPNPARDASQVPGAASAPLFRRAATALSLPVVRPTLTDGSPFVLPGDSLGPDQRAALETSLTLLVTGTGGNFAGLVAELSRPAVRDQLDLLLRLRPPLSELRPLLVDVFETRGFGKEAVVELLVFQEAYKSKVLVTLELGAQPVITGITWEERGR